MKRRRARLHGTTISTAGSPDVSPFRVAAQRLSNARADRERPAGVGAQDNAILAFLAQAKSSVVEYFDGGFAAGALCAKDYRATCPKGTEADLAAYKATVHIALRHTVDELKRKGATADELAAWAGGFSNAIAHHSLPFNFAVVNNV